MKVYVLITHGLDEDGDGGLHDWPGIGGVYATEAAAEAAGKAMEGSGSGIVSYEVEEHEVHEGEAALADALTACPWNPLPPHYTICPEHHVPINQCPSPTEEHEGEP